MFSRRRYLRSFKSCPRVGGILLGMHQLNLRMLGFKSCPRVGGIHNQIAQLKRAREFQVGPPCGGHRIWLPYKYSLSLFQVVPPCGGHL